MKHNAIVLLIAACAVSGLTARAQTPAPSAPTDSVAVAAPTAAPAQGAVVLTRDECVRIALEQNPTIRVADMEIKRMDYSKRETVAQLFPTLDFALNYQRSIQLQTMKMGMGGQTQSIKMGMDNQWNMGFTLAVPVIAPQLWKSLDISDTQILITAENARASRLDMAEAVSKAYYAWLLANDSKAVLQQNYDNARFNADLYAKRFALGTATEYDVLRSEVQVKNVEPDLLQADIAIKQAKLQLKVLMGMDFTVDIAPAVKLADYQKDMYDYTSSLSTEIWDNTSMRTLALNTRLASQTLDLKKRAFIPTMAASFNLAWSSISNGNMFKHLEFNPYSTVGFTISVPLLSGGSRYFGVKQAKVQLDEMQFERENLARNLRMQVDLAVDNINKEVRQIDTSAEGVRQAVKAHQIMQKSFEIGAGTYLDLRDAELGETQARLGYYQAIYNYLVSTAELETLLGRNPGN